MEKKKSEGEIAKGFREDMKKRGIVNEHAQLAYLRNQKIKKRDASRARAIKAEGEIQVIDMMLEGTI
jgi:hypothetical protein